MTRLYPATVDLESGDISLEDVCAAEWAEYKQALDTVLDLEPGRVGMAGKPRYWNVSQSCKKM